MHSSVRHLKEFVSHLYPKGVVKHQTSLSFLWKLVFHHLWIDSS